jgi:hypothetical protein
MPESIQIIVEAVEGNTAALKDVQAKLTGIKTTTEQVTKQQLSMGEQFKRSWTEINNAIGMVERGFRLVKDAVDATVGSFVEYADQVRTISQITGQNTEEVSKLIQVTDDYKISTDSLEQVMRKLANEGLSLTISSLAQLSDEYLKLEDGVERQTFLTENFGRTGADFAEIMLQGSAAIRDQSNAIADNLVLTQDAIDKAREFEKANDELGDSWKGLMMSIGAQIAPQLTIFLQGMAALIAGDWEGVAAANAAAAALVFQGDETEKTGEKTEKLTGYMRMFKTSVDNVPTSKTTTIDVKVTGDTWIFDYMGGGEAGNNSGDRGGYIPPLAGGGDFKGWAMVGDAPGGKKTPYTEYVYAPQGARVYNQSQIGNVQAPPMAGGGSISPIEGFDYDKLAIIVRDAVLLGPQ